MMRLILATSALAGVSAATEPCAEPEPGTHFALRGIGSLQDLQQHASTAHEQVAKVNGALESVKGTLAEHKDLFDDIAEFANRLETRHEITAVGHVNKVINAARGGAESATAGASSAMEAALRSLEEHALKPEAEETSCWKLLASAKEVKAFLVEHESDLKAVVSLLVGFSLLGSSEEAAGAAGGARTTKRKRHATKEEHKQCAGALVTAVIGGLESLVTVVLPRFVGLATVAALACDAVNAVRPLGCSTGCCSTSDASSAAVSTDA